MPTRKTQLATLLASLFVLLIVLLFNAWLNMSALKKNYVASLVGSYTVAGGECRRKIEYAVRYGKPLDNFYGMKELLQEVKQDAAELDDVRVVGLDGSVMYDVSGKTSGRLPARLLKEADFKPGLTTSPVIRFEGKYELFIPVHDQQGRCIGLLNLVFDEAVVASRVQVFWQQNLREMVLVAALSAALLGAALFAIPVVSRTGMVRNRRIFAILLTVLSAAQLYYGFSNIALLKGMYFDIARKNIQLSGRIIQKDIDQVLQKGVPFNDLRGIDAWFETIMRMMPETGRIVVSDTQGKTCYAAVAPQSGQAVSVSYTFPLIRSVDGEQGMLQVALSRAYIDAKLKDARLDVLTILVTSFFLTIELIVFLLFLLNARSDSIEPGTQAPAGVQYIRIIRPLAFLFFIVFDMSISFIPVYMKKLYEPLLGLPKDIVLGLPISAEMFCIALSSYAAGLMIDKKGWRQPFYLGLAVVALGVLLSAAAQTALFFILARGVIGIGYGLTLVAMEGYLLSSPAKDARMAGFSQLYAGLYAGKLCAAALGAMLAERLGYAAVFIIQIVMLAVPLFFALSFATGRSTPPTALQQPAPASTQGTLRRFICNRKIITFFLLITLPSMVCTVGFLCYFFPLYANSIGVSTSNTGRAFMMYGICFIMLGPWFGAYLGKRSDAMRYVYAAGGIGVTAMLVFFWQGSFISALVAIFLLGMADTMNSVAQTGYFLSMEATHAFGEGKGLGLLRLTRKIGEALGPIVFGWLLMFGTQAGVGLAGGIYLVIMLVFVLLTRLYGASARAVE